jgi:IgGFc binding protein
VHFRYSLAAVGSAAVVAVVVACGARTGLEAGVPIDRADAESPFGEGGTEGGPTDAHVECDTPAYCDPADPGHILRCGVSIFQCGSLEQCEDRGEGAQCVNPCLDSLGNDTSNGCEFYAIEMDTTPDTEGVCYAVFVVNQWKSGESAKIEVSLSGNVLPIEQFARIPAGTGTNLTYGPYSAAGGLPTNEIAILFLSRDPAATSDPHPTWPRKLADCPAGVVPAVVGDAALHGTGSSTAFRIRTNVPVVAYQMLPYGGGRARVTGSTLLLPTSAWGTNYVVADAYQAPSVLIPPSTDARAGPVTAIVASHDATHVTVKPTATIVAGGGLQGTASGTPITYTLNHGQYLQFTQNDELTGSAVQADAPVAVIGGSTLMDIPLNTNRADSAEQMLPPVQALGSEYVAVRYRNRGTTEETPPWRIVGVVDGTVLAYEGADPSKLPTGAPFTVNAGELAEFTGSGPFVVRSQDANHPFYFASYMTGGQPFDGTGDPEFIDVVPPKQYLPRYTFFTDPTYPETNLVVVRVRDATTGLMPTVTLDCAGVLGGWTPVGTAGTYEMTRVDLSTGNFQGVGMCDNGVHTIEAKLDGAIDGQAPAVPFFGVTIWGWGNDITWPTDDPTSNDEANPKFTRWVSYGYPAGANFKPLNTAILSAK